MFTEQRPPLSLESDQAVDNTYAHYASRPARPWIAKFLAPAFGVLAYRGQTVFEDDAEMVIGDHLANDGRALLSLEHVYKSDPFVVAGQAARRRSTRSLVGNTNITAKAELYHLHRVVRWFLDKADAQPAFQGHKDNSAFAPQSTEEEIEARIRRAGDRVVENSIRFINEDDSNIANFARSGRRKEGDDTPITADKLKKGVGRIACGVDDRSNLLVIPGAVNYDRGLWRPSFAMANPIQVTETSTPESIMELAAAGMQRAREMAAALSQLRLHERPYLG